MAYKRFVCMNIALVGDEQLVIRQAIDLAGAGHAVHIGTREGEVSPLHYRNLNQFENVFFGTVADVAAVADVIVISSPIDEVREMAYLMEDVRNKIIIDRTAMHFSIMGNYLNTVSAIKAITGAEHIVKVYGGYKIDVVSMLQLEDSTIERVMVGDSLKAKATVNALLRDAALERSLDMGGADRIPWMDEMANAWRCKSLAPQPEELAKKST